MIHRPSSAHASGLVVPPVKQTMHYTGRHLGCFMSSQALYAEVYYQVLHSSTAEVFDTGLTDRVNDLLGLNDKPTNAPWLTYY